MTSDPYRAPTFSAKKQAVVTRFEREVAIQRHIEDECFKARNQGWPTIEESLMMEYFNLSKGEVAVTLGKLSQSERDELFLEILKEVGND